MAFVATALVACHRAVDSELVGEWNCPAIGPWANVTYKVEHTYSGRIDDPNKGTFAGSGTWRIEGSEMICRDYERGESRAEILTISRKDLQIKGSDGVISTYKRIK